MTDQTKVHLAQVCWGISVACVVWTALIFYNGYQEKQRHARATMEVLDQDRQHLVDAVDRGVKRHEWPKTVREGWRKYVLLQDAIQEEASLAVDTAWAEICDPQDPVCRIVRLAQERDALLRWLRARHTAGEQYHE